MLGIACGCGARHSGPGSPRQYGRSQDAVYKRQWKPGAMCAITSSRPDSAVSPLPLEQIGHVAPAVRADARDAVAPILRLLLVRRECRIAGIQVDLPIHERMRDVALNHETTVDRLEFVIAVRAVHTESHLCALTAPPAKGQGWSDPAYPSTLLPVSPSQSPTSVPICGRLAWCFLNPVERAGTPCPCTSLLDSRRRTRTRGPMARRAGRTTRRATSTTARDSVT